ncbi:NfeD family protein [Bacillus carboniphilus]|uniref:NfeD family protein n=1 Tax=Bacillus carboniphilus TaxID=86663 RepID=A0ABN0W8C5_9BACI
MELFGTPIETIYLTALIISGIITVLYILFGDVLEGVAEATGFLNPTLILSFITFFSASGYLFEQLTPLNSLLIIAISAIIAIILDVLLNVFVLVPLASAEESLVYTEESLKGRIGKVIISVPEDGFGEVVIESNSGNIAKPAASFDDLPIKEGSQVLVVDIKSGVLYVTPHESFDELLK